MDTSWYEYIVVSLALIAANAPFLLPAQIRQRLITFFPRLVALVLMYFVVGAISFAIEAMLGKVMLQEWEFYAITFCLFLTFAFPGFCYRYLFKK